MSFYKYCPKCGDINFIDKCTNCDFCGEPYILTNYEHKPDDWCNGTNKRETIFEECIKNNPQFDEKLYNKRMNILRYGVTPKSQPQNVPKCPTCGSTNVHPISTGKKAFGFAMVGIFSKNFGKSYECDNCKYRW